MNPPTCPFLGLEEDSTTALGYPSEGNFCHHARPIAAVSLEHQERFCLTTGHVSCPIYKRANLTALPPALTAPSYLQSRKQRAVTILATLLLVLFLVAIALVGFKMLPWIGTHLLPVPVTGDKQAGFFADNNGLTMLEPTLTPLQPETATSSPKLQVPNCDQPDGWTTYVVNPTDSLFRLSVVYSVSVEELQQRNCMGTNTTILPGQVLYVPFIPTMTPSATLVPPSPGVVSQPTIIVVAPEPTHTPGSRLVPVAPWLPTSTKVPATVVPSPTLTPKPSSTPSVVPTSTATKIIQPTATTEPTRTPIFQITLIPLPTLPPTRTPTRVNTPTRIPTEKPTSTPTTVPTAIPTDPPVDPTAEPTDVIVPTAIPTAPPVDPTAEPTDVVVPTAIPTDPSPPDPTAEPTDIVVPKFISTNLPQTDLTTVLFKYRPIK